MLSIIIMAGGVLAVLVCVHFRIIRIGCYVWRKCTFSEFSHACHVAFYLRGTGLSVVGLLHDMVEDEYATMDELDRKFHIMYPEVYLLEILTRRSSETYFEYIDRVLESPVASEIKLADLHHNIKRCLRSAGKFDGRLRRYYRAYLKLKKV